MFRILVTSGLVLLITLVSNHISAQQTTPATKPFIVSPVVGDVIDQQEKATYSLFPYYSANNFVEARFVRLLTPDSTVQLRTLLRDGRTVLRPFTAAELAAVRTSISTRQQELARLSSSTPAADSVGRRFRVFLRTGTVFDGELTATQPTLLEFLTSDLGVVQVSRRNIIRLEELTSQTSWRQPDRFDIGNGNRMFFQPTARNLRRNEGSVQYISVFVVGLNYGLTNNLSMGAYASLIPGLGLDEQLFALTPKVSAKVSDKFYAGGGLLYLRGFGGSAGVFYGNTTFGSADNNFTAGLGYGFSDGDVNRSPVIQLGGQTRISRRVSLISENYILTNRNSGAFGLYGAKINWERTSLGLGAFYLFLYREEDDFFDTRSRVYSSYIFPLYIDFTFRFGKGSR
ncbi:hypothetical protein J0X19_21430 [Hymenobacter sp. BT186]|uniref:Uncharacterized protein n=1 Tax=Hymenobacter telluris TaxID=2816474 RepID=A0A939JF19_9BACT|nr:hypothetical protein [Hymenobacter telluris]MBO0360538.1 hypothetical protein [Hymenobacter telluris]MBW3376565.1 hypothetical protein [Hymenobacter norwichensis]